MIRGALVVIALVFWLAAMARPAAAESPAGYRRELQAALDALGVGDPQAAERAAEHVRAVEIVTFPDGTAVHPDNWTILRALAARPPDVEAARSGLIARLAVLDDASGPPANPVGVDARGRLREILARPEFQPAPPPNPLARAVRRVERFVGNLLVSILERIFGGGAAGDLRTMFWAAVGMLAIGGIVTVAIRGLRQSVGPAVTSTLGDLATPAATSETARAEAARFAQSGAFRLAMRALYLAALLSWDEQGRLRFDRTLTNQEVLARARSLDDVGLVERLAPLVDRFDQVWYGGSPCSFDDYRIFERLAGQAWEAS